MIEMTDITVRMQELYLSHHGKVILPAADDEAEKETRELRTAYAATLAVNLASIGFGVSEKDVLRLAACSVEDIAAFYEMILPACREALGDGYEYHPFYPGFPKEVMRKDRAEIFLDQLLYALSGFSLDPEHLSPKDYASLKKAFPFVGKITMHALHFADVKEYRQDMRTVAASAVAYTEGQIQELYEFFLHDPRAGRFLPDLSELKQRENRILLGILWQRAGGDDGVLWQSMETPADVLRYAAAVSAERDFDRKVKEEKVQEAVQCAAVDERDKKGSTAGQQEEEPVFKEAPVSLDEDEKKAARVLQAASLQYNPEDMPSFRISRPERRFVMRALERMSRGRSENLAAQMYVHRKEWKLLLNRLHYDEMQKEGCPALAGAAHLVHENTSIDRYEKRIEEAIRADDFDTALKEAAARPGDFMRRFDKLLRMSIDCKKTELLLSRLEALAPKSGIAPVMALMGHIGARDKDEQERIFYNQKTQTTFRTEEKNREALPKECIERVQEACRRGISRKFEGKGQMGRVYISPLMKNYAAPLSVRTMNEGVDVKTFGSVEKIDGRKDVLRLFVGWSNTESERVDIDLTAEIILRDGSRAHVGWDGDYDFQDVVVYSGDVRTGDPDDGWEEQDTDAEDIAETDEAVIQEDADRETAPRGAADCGAEFVDISLPLAEAAGVQYIICGVTIYCGADSFAELSHCDFGFMERGRKEGGELFDTRTVQSKMHLGTKGSQFVPLVYDVAGRRIIWVNRDIAESQDEEDWARGRVMSANISQVTDLLPIIKVQTNNAVTCDDLIRMNAASNGVLTEDPKEADLLFVTAGELQAIKAKKDRDGRRKEELPLQKREVHLPTDYAYFTGVLMAEPVEGRDLFHPEQD